MEPSDNWPKIEVYRPQNQSGMFCFRSELFKRLGRVNTTIVSHLKIYYCSRMKITPKQYDQIKDVLPVQRGNVVVENIDFLNAILYIAENGCKWRALPKEFGPWHTIYTRMSRWAKKGVWPRVLEALKTKLLIEIDRTALSLDSTSVKVHPDGMGPLKKTDNNPSAKAGAAGTQRSMRLSPMQ